jgi:hypothetical protein
MYKMGVYSIGTEMLRLYQPCSNNKDGQFIIVIMMVSIEKSIGHLTIDTIANAKPTALI